MNKTLLTLGIGLLGSAAALAQSDIPANPVKPTPQQLRYQQQELIGFLHLTVNTFTDREWGTGQEDPAIFNPTQLDARQWVRVAKDAGMKTLILTAKHHDGFCLWPSKYTDHSVKSSPWKGGKGDVVRDLADACREAGIKLGLYLSPWDMHEPKYGTSEYNQFYLNQLRELLTNYGPVAEVWMDGAKGENAKNMSYDFDAYRALIRQLQPQAVIFSDVGPGVRWIGNEKGFAGETCWSTINTEGMDIGKADSKYLNTGDPKGDEWIPGECDVSIRPGWFYHPAEDAKVKTPKQLVDVYYKSVGRNGTLLLNLPPDRRGLIHESDVAALKGMRAILDETFRANLAGRRTARASASTPAFPPRNLTDGNADTYWAASAGQTTATLDLDLGRETTFDRIALQEPVRLGQRVSAFRVEAEQNGQWKPVASGTTIGYKRLLRLDAPVQARRIRVVIEQANNTAALSEIAVYKASPNE
ncbi:alpha-L-fucosidase [Larkinella soli]|uniref:alpha-L-fucosidase n=1 Tax=Larkinella soli TaxID=1770527 RepID=UPI000FFC8769|nr:alpha-L-fucosidase [Larkinella soli]